MAEHPTYVAVVQVLLSDPRVVEVKMFGMPTLKVGGKAFASLWENGDLVVKIGAPRVHELLTAKAGRQFDPSGKGRPMKEWIMIKAPAAQAKKKWLTLAEEAKAFVDQP
ncbi:MAG: hypothetical protein U0559_21170 [Anaerolineae bacterium]